MVQEVLGSRGRVGFPSVLCGLLWRGVLPFFFFPSFLILPLRGNTSLYPIPYTLYPLYGLLMGLGLRGTRNILVGSDIPLTWGPRRLVPAFAFFPCVTYLTLSLPISTCTAWL